MSETTNIEWADHTGSPWLGCSIVSPGCGHCYAKELAESRLGSIFRRAYKAAGFEDWDTRPVWGDKATRVLSKGFWKDAVAINAKHAKAGTRGKWFMSMIDWLDEMPAGIIDQDGNTLNPVEVLARLLRLMHDCQNLDFLNLTKRPENWHSGLLAAIKWNENTGGAVPLHHWMLEWITGTPPENIWIGASVEDQQRADERIPELLKIPARVRFLSAEPLLGPIALPTHPVRRDGPGLLSHGDLRDWIDWVIIGGESGPGARPCNVEWIRDIVRQCKAAGVACFVKQLGARPVCDVGWSGPLKMIRHPKGGDPSEWPEGLRVREFPEVKP